jgi:XTP/dITP diphosphohydrolase
MTLWIATSNAGKLNEFRNILGSKVEIRSTKELSYYSSPPETGATFVDNARIKARTIKAMKPGEWVVADDSGLEVPGLDNLPGVHSARYAGPNASDRENVAKLLKMIQIRSAQKREAQFRCVFVAYDPQGQEHIIEGTVTGKIANSAQGTAGFGYDPVFIPDGHDKTFGDLGLAVKNQISHRAKAIRQLMALMQV